MTTNQKNRYFEVSSSLILHNNNEPFPRLDCDIRWKVDCIQQPVMTSSAQWLEWEVPKHFPKPNLPSKKVVVTVWWSAAGLIHYSFLNAGKTILSEKYAQQKDEMHWKLQHIGKQKGNSSSCQHLPTHCTISSSKVYWIWLQSFASSTRFSGLSSRQLTTTSSSISTTFCRENASITSKGQKMLFRSLSNHVFCCFSVTKLCPTLCNPLACSTPDFPVLHYLLEFAQTHVRWVSDAIQPSHPLSHPFPPAPYLSQCQGLFQWVSCCIRWMKYGSFNLSISPSNEYSNPLGLTGLISLLSEIPKRLLQHHN